MKSYAQEVSRYALKMPPLIREDAGVYALECSTTGKTYVGCSRNIEGRLRTHVNALRAGKHGNGKLQNSWNKYGERSFTFSVLQYTSDIYACEKRWVRAFDAEKTGLNLTEGGDGCAMNSASEVSERRAKITAAIRTKEVREKIGAWSKKQWAENYDSMCQARSDAAKKQWADPEMKAKTSALRKARWAARSPEERAAIMKKMLATRKANAS